MTNLIDVVRDNFFVSMLSTCIILGMVLRSITAMVTSISRERTRREIAAYIAEGSMTPEQGERLMRANVNSHHQHAA
jgi:Flp pilus assembly protein TadD